MTAANNGPGVSVGADPDLHFQTIAVVERGSLGGPYIIDLVTVQIKRKKGRKPHETALEMIRAIKDRLPCPVTHCAGLHHGLVVEGQQSYLGKNQKARPEDLIALAMVGGALVDRLSFFGTTVRYPLPREWKKGVPKGIHQGRICKRLGWSYKRRNDYVIPTDFGSTELGGDLVSGAQWKHAMDSIGLALWGLDR